LEPLATERQFFSAPLEAKLESLDQVLADDFLLIDVSGSEISKPALLGAIGSGQLKFEAIEVVESRVRLYSGTAVSTNARKSGPFRRSALFRRQQIHACLRRATGPLTDGRSESACQVN